MYLTADSLLLNIMSDSGANEYVLIEMLMGRRMSQDKRGKEEKRVEKSMW